MNLNSVASMTCAAHEVIVIYCQNYSSLGVITTSELPRVVMNFKKIDTDICC